MDNDHRKGLIGFIALVLLFISIVYLDAYKATHRPAVVTYKAPAPPMVVREIGPNHEPELRPRRDGWEHTWTGGKKEEHSCLQENPPCGAIFTMGGERVDYDKWQLERELGE